MIVYLYGLCFYFMASLFQETAVVKWHFSDRIWATKIDEHAYMNKTVKKIHGLLLAMCFALGVSAAVAAATREFSNLVPLGHDQIMVENPRRVRWRADAA